MIAVKAARAYTQRSKIAKMEGGYHGLHGVSAGRPGYSTLMPKNPFDVPATMSRTIDALFHNWDAPDMPGGLMACVLSE